MRVLIAGATGAVGRSLIPALLARGHHVGGLSRRPQLVDDLGGQAIMADALDRNQLIRSVQTFAPEVVIHELTSLPRSTTLMRFDRDFEKTNRLRREGTDNLLEAAREAGVRRFIAQSFCGWPFERTGTKVKSETDPLDRNPPAQLRNTLDAIRYLEGVVIGASDLKGTILRYGGFYGPHTHLAIGASMAKQILQRRFPIVGEGSGIWSFAHIEDIAGATVLATEADHAGTFHVTDDEPAPVSLWLPYLARVLGAPAPPRVPKWLARLLLPEHLFAMLTEIRGASNALFRETFKWDPKYPSWRQGFAAEFGLQSPR